jgi:hypothetical protein
MDWDPISFVKLAILAVAIGATVICFLLLRNKRREIGLGVFSLVFTIVVAEVFLRLFYPQIMEHDKMFEYDPDLGWKFRANCKGSILYPGEASHYIQTNSLGFRDNQPPSEKDKARRIIVLGDSFVSNVAVRDNEVFTEVMERALPNTAVLNFGVNGYGQVQEYLLLQRWLDKLRPDLIIVLIYLRNDFDDNLWSRWVIYPRPVAFWDESGSTLHISPPGPAPPPAAVEPYWRSYRGWHLYRLIDREMYKLKETLSGASSTEYESSPSTPQELYLCRRGMSEQTKVKYRTMEELLLRIRSYVDGRRVPLVFALAPSVEQVDEKLWSSVLRQYGEREEDYVRSLPGDRLMHFAAEKGLAMLDLLPVLEVQERKGGTLYNLKEQHWTSEGNRVVADSLLAYLRNKSLIK